MFQSLPVGQHGGTTDSAYFVLVDMYLKYFLPTEGSVPPSPFSDNRGSVSAPTPRYPRADGQITCIPLILARRRVMQPTISQPVSMLPNVNVVAETHLPNARAGRPTSHWQVTASTVPVC